MPYIHGKLVFRRSTYRFDGRFLLVRMENFQKSDFDAVKKRVNHAVNREFHLPQRYAAGELAYKMRFYILYTEAANDELMRHISRNAETLLRRAEGVMTFALCGDSLIGTAALWRCGYGCRAAVRGGYPDDA